AAALVRTDRHSRCQAAGRRRSRSPYMTIRSVLVLLFALAAAGCAGPGIDAYRDEKPVLDLARYFDGHIDAWGVFRDRSGNVVKRFKVDIKASWKGDVGVLEEDFSYSDGTT